MDILRPRNLIFPLLTVSLLTLAYNTPQTELVDYIKGHASSFGIGDYLGIVEDGQDALMAEKPINLHEDIEAALDRDKSPVAVEAELQKDDIGSDQVHQADKDFNVEKLEIEKKPPVGLDKKASDEL